MGTTTLSLRSRLGLGLIQAGGTAGAIYLQQQREKNRHGTPQPPQSFGHAVLEIAKDAAPALGASVAVAVGRALLEQPVAPKTGFPEADYRASPVSHSSSVNEPLLDPEDLTDPISSSPAHNGQGGINDDDDAPRITPCDRFKNGALYVGTSVLVNGLFGAAGYGIGKIHDVARHISPNLVAGIGAQIGAAATSVYNALPEVRPAFCKK